MNPVTKNKEMNAPPDISVSSGAIAPSDESKQLEQTGVETSEPNVGHTLGRLSHKSIFILFAIFTHWVTKLLSVKTHEENNWLVIVLLNVSNVYAAIHFTVIYGAELIEACTQAVKHAMRSVREK